MDEAEREAIPRDLRQDAEFRAQVQRELLTDELLAVPQAVALLAASVSGLIEHQAEMQRQLTSIHGAVASLQSDVADVMTTTKRLLDVTQMAFAEFRHGFAVVEERFSRVEADIREIKDRPAPWVRWPYRRLSSFQVVFDHHGDQRSGSRPWAPTSAPHVPSGVSDQ